MVREPVKQTTNPFVYCHPYLRYPNEFYTNKYILICVISSLKYCGFREGYNTQNALMELLEDWRYQLDKKQIVGVIVCDLSKAFDTSPHDFLISELDAYGFGERSLAFLFDYLNGRIQRCKVGSFYSFCLDIQTGVPQGSVL